MKFKIGDKVVNANTHWTGIIKEIEKWGPDEVYLVHYTNGSDYWECEKSLTKEILDKEEKEYLENLLRPFRDRVSSIYKHKWDNSREYIKIYMKFNETIRLPLFTNNTMYKGIELNKEYTLEELGLFRV